MGRFGYQGFSDFLQPTFGFNAPRNAAIKLSLATDSERPRLVTTEMSRDTRGAEIGRITSGSFSPSLQRPIAMGYVAIGFAAPGTVLKLEQRGKLFDATVIAMPFVAHQYHRKPAGA